MAFASDRVITVEMGEWKRASRKGHIITNSLGPCIGVAIYDVSTKTGFLAHTYGPETHTISHMLSEIAKLNNKPSGLLAWLTGNAPDDPELKALITSADEEQVYKYDIREDVTSLLHRVGIEGDHLEEKWLNNSDHIGAIDLDCQTGECVTTVSSFRETRDYWLNPDVGY